MSCSFIGKIIVSGAVWIQPCLQTVFFAGHTYTFFNSITFSFWNIGRKTYNVAVSWARRIANFVNIDKPSYSKITIGSIFGLFILRAVVVYLAQSSRK